MYAVRFIYIDADEKLRQSVVLCFWQMDTDNQVQVKYAIIFLPYLVYKDRLKGMLNLLSRTASDPF